ncbi:hypothetical protein ACFOOM_11985 [Streptomyces echinoruber]|uniref:Uncharacterized protein n=1 Tax=Streptomyces echinoruber TaxID=68898 RepID=A0A918V3G0_9ACTN|nr:hypothetical protein [Streptomyces echinoruber]GGZ67094.1 hypothetical protein GCM10010389_00230 [Streptomyces echinoruber]
MTRTLAGQETSGSTASAEAGKAAYTALLHGEDDRLEDSTDIAPWLLLRDCTRKRLSEGR